MLIADSQVHLWGADTPQRPWPAGRGVEAQKPYPVTRDMLLFEMELAKVDRIVIDQVGLNIRQKAPKVFEDLPAVCALAKHPNIAVKASGMPSLSTQTYPFRDLHDAIKKLVDSFGPRRTFWGTALTRMPCSYRECVDLFTKEQQSWLKGEDLEWVMGRAVCEWLGWRI